MNIAILGCGTVGGGVATIIREMNKELALRSNTEMVLKTIVELNPDVASERFNIPPNLFAGGGKKLTVIEAAEAIDQIITSPEIDLVVETIGGTSDFVHDICMRIVKAGKHLVTANKALLAERGCDIFEEAEKHGVKIGFEAAVCGAIPIVKTIKENFTGDKILSISGIMNGTSNYILSRMQNEGLGFENALQLAQENGYAEADPALDINGGDAGHKIILLIKLAYGIDVSMNDLAITGIENIKKEDIEFANEIDAKIKLICYAKKINGDIFATVRPMMVKNSNFLSGVNGATNAVRVNTKYSGKHILVGKGAGSSETAMSIVSDMVFIARYGEKMRNTAPQQSLNFADARQFVFPYLITFHTADLPGTTGFITTAIGSRDINIDTVSHNRHQGEKATFSVATMPCRLEQIETAIEKIKTERPGMLLSEPKVMPILY
ncbi:MAG: homoserine dehydrogenase [Prolixibacteraceae bacterium]|nr:homoserine dehydrogenase [Prolixibacteraceae bacterium]MBN2648775.1 homoserine dehydrogenase [Prolixibacteraceae bacterium]